MPLRATLDGQDVFAGDLDAAAWAVLKSRRAPLLMPCCEARAIMRVSKLGLQHFAHYSRHSVCDWKPETEDHLRAKMEIVMACRAAGWRARPEARADDGAWRADVLAWRETRRGTLRVAFEVQLSAQPRAETEARQSRYAAAQIRGCWLIRPRSPTKYSRRNEHFINPSAHLPAFRLILESDRSLRVAIPRGHSEDIDRVESLSDFVQGLLSRKIRFATHTTNNVGRRIRAVFVATDCWRCGATMHYYYLDTTGDDPDRLSRDGLSRAACGRVVRSHWTGDPLAPDVVAAITDHIREDPSLGIRLGAIKERNSKSIGRALSFGCPDCDALYGWAFLSKKVPTRAQDGTLTLPAVELDLPPSSNRSPDPHWCYPVSELFCEHLPSHIEAQR